MARARNIKPSFFKNEELAELTYEARLLFIGTWTLADREGRLEDRPKKIKMEVFPADSVDVNKLLLHLHESKFILRYEVDGKRFIQVMKFLKHQNPHHREPGSSIPPAPESLILEWLGNGVGPEAGDLFKDSKTRGSPSANPVPAVLNPDSLIPEPGSLTADSRSLIPESPSRIPEPGEKQHRSQGASPPAARKVKRANGEAGIRTSATWHAYREAYLRRYGQEPVRNAMVNTHIAGFVARIGVAESPAVAAFYVGHNRDFYVSKQHSTKFLVADAEGLRTEWANGRPMTTTEARQTDRTAATGNVFNKLIEEA